MAWARARKLELLERERGSRAKGASPKARASRERERGGLELRARARKLELEPLSRGASWLGREPKARATRERGGLVRARAQWLSTSREWGLMLGREPGRDPARVGKGNTGIAGGGGLDAKCRVLTETAGGPSLARGRLVPWRPVVAGPPSVEAHKPTVRAPSSRGCGWFTSARALSLSIPRRRGREPRARGSQEGLHAWGKP